MSRKYNILELKYSKTKEFLRNVSYPYRKEIESQLCNFHQTWFQASKGFNCEWQNVRTFRKKYKNMPLCDLGGSNFLRKKKHTIWRKDQFDSLKLTILLTAWLYLKRWKEKPKLGENVCKTQNGRGWASETSKEKRRELTLILHHGSPLQGGVRKAEVPGLEGNGWGKGGPAAKTRFRFREAKLGWNGLRRRQRPGSAG